MILSWRPWRPGGFLRVLAALGAFAGSAATPSPAQGDTAGAAWSAWSASPVPVAGASVGSDPLERDAMALCGVADAGLQGAARGILQIKLAGLPMPEPDAIAQLQRRQGEPHPWARAFAASGRSLRADETLAQLRGWLGAAPPLGVRRCGIAVGQGTDGTRALAAVSVDALADLTPVPTQIRLGQWITVEARLRAQASGGEVIALGPAGAPRTLPTSFDGTTLRARFAAERSGEFLLQVVADLRGGSRPVLEATVFADAPPHDDTPGAPGEDAENPRLADDEQVVRMTEIARASVGLAALARNASLDAIAVQHALRMASRQELGHDLGDGDPAERLRRGGVDAPFVGENVAHAPTLRLAHRALWGSPSHRANLLRREFVRLGVGVARDAKGEVWLAEEFASR